MSCSHLIHYKYPEGSFYGAALNDLITRDTYLKMRCPPPAIPFRAYYSRSMDYQHMNKATDGTTEESGFNSLQEQRILSLPQ